jgi:hypothetical protein
MRDAAWRENRRLDWQQTAVVRKGNGVFAPQQNAKLLQSFVRDLADGVLQQPQAQGRMHIFAADIHRRPPANWIESFEDRDALRSFVGQARELPDVTCKMDEASRQFHVAIPYPTEVALADLSHGSIASS